MTIKMKMDAKLIELECKLRDAREAMANVNLAWVDVFDEPGSVIDQLAAENWSLRQALTYYYTPTEQEYRDWDEHCAEMTASGGSPPGEGIHWSNIAVARRETDYAEDSY